MFQGLGPNSDMPTGTNTLFFIHRDQVPKQKRATYIRVVCADRPEKSNTRRVRWTAGGDKIEYHGSVTTKTADITTARLLFNSVLSTPEAKLMTINLKDFYLCSDLNVYEYVRIPTFMLSPRTITLYNLEAKIHDGYIYAEVRKGMYGLPHAGKLANDRLRSFLAPAGYIPCRVTPGLWRHQHSNLMFSLVVDDFGIRYTKRDDVEQLIAMLEREYKCTIDWEGNRYVGLTLAGDYDKGTCDLSMPGYIQRALLRFEHPDPGKAHDAPHEWNAPTHGA
jgi:hypothetical protein